MSADGRLELPFAYALFLCHMCLVHFQLVEDASSLLGRDCYLAPIVQFRCGLLVGRLLRGDSR